MEKKIEKLIVTSFYIYIKILSFLYLILPKIFKVINFYKTNRFYRSIYIRESLKLVKKIFNSLNYNIPTTISENEIILNVNGVLLYLDNISRYLKLTKDNKYYNGARYCEDLFDFSNAKIFLDIGSFIGYYACFVLKYFNQKIKVYAIESNEKYCNYIEKSIGINNFDNVEVIN